MIPEAGHWLRKALSTETKWVGAQPPIHLRIEMYPVYKTLSTFLECKIMNKVRKQMSPKYNIPLSETVQN